MIIDEMEIDETGIRNDYIKIINSNIISYSKIVSIIAIPALVYFIWTDLTYRNLPTLAIVFRSIPIVISLIILSFHIFSPVRYINILKIIYFIFLLSFMVMMAGLLGITVSTDIFYIYVMGTVVIIFCIYAGSFHSMKSMILIYFLPLLFLEIYFIFVLNLSVYVYGTLSNVIITAVICSVSADYREKMRFREFRSSKIIELQNEKFNKDLQLARAIQYSLIPVRKPEIEGIDLSSIYTPMLGIGGDFYDYIELADKDSFGIFISDVSGHGVSAALISSMVKTLIITSGDHKNSPGSLLKFINEKLIGHTNGNFVTAFYGIYNSTEKTLKYARGGHEYPLLINESGVTELISDGKFLGIMQHLSFEEITINLNQGDKILYFTDGLTQAYDANRIAFCVKLIPEILVQNCRMKNADFIQHIYSRLLNFCGKEYFDDDVCIVGMEIK
jgi:hypothetical protein